MSPIIGSYRYLEENLKLKGKHSNFVPPQTNQSVICVLRLPQRDLGNYELEALN